VYENEVLWTAGCGGAAAPNNLQVHRLDGDTGAVLDTIDVLDMPCFSFAAYGGAADAQGNFWWTSNEGPTSRLGRIDAVTLQWKIWTAPVWAYGMTIDHTGRPWLTVNVASSFNYAAARFDPATEIWDLATNHVARGYSGIGEDASGRMWSTYTYFDGSSTIGAFYMDVDTMMVSDPIPYPNASSWMNGVSADASGKIWTLDPVINTAFRYDPGTGQIDSYAGLDYPYTYSDMTGAALAGVVCNPEG
jgi:streptogramin lyase